MSRRDCRHGCPRSSTAVHHVGPLTSQLGGPCWADGGLAVKSKSSTDFSRERGSREAAGHAAGMADDARPATARTSASRRSTQLGNPPRPTARRRLEWRRSCIRRWRVSLSGVADRNTRCHADGYGDHHPARGYFPRSSGAVRAVARWWVVGEEPVLEVAMPKLH